LENAIVKNETAEIHVGELFCADIVRLGKLGDGVAYHPSGKVVFVLNASLQNNVWIRVIKIGFNHAEGVIVDKP
jgi:predicted RNA-binding protein with TRAM domain